MENGREQRQEGIGLAWAPTEDKRDHLRWFSLYPAWCREALVTDEENLLDQRS